MQAVAPFTLDAFDQSEPHDTVDGVALARAAITKTFSGDIDASSTVDMLTAMGAGGGAGYVALERITGTVHGRAGSFVLLHAGTMTPDDQWATWPVVPGSGTGDLAGIRGEGRIDIDAEGGHTFTLEYEIA